MNGWNASAIIAAVLAIVGAGVSWGQNVQIDADQDRRIEHLESQAEDYQDLAIQQATTNVRLESTNNKIAEQTAAIGELTKSLQVLSRQLQAQ